jgi:hypothetical protein
MKRLISILGATLLAFAAACGGSGGSEDALITAEWSFSSVEGDNLGCPSGFDTTEVTAVSATGGPDVFVDLYDCEEPDGTSDYPPDDYDVTLAVINRGSGALYAESLEQTADIIEVDAVVGENFIDDGGRLIVDWDLREADDDTLLSCLDADADGIVVTATLAGGGEVEDFTFDCDGPAGLSKPLFEGNYSIQIEAVDVDDVPVGVPFVQDTQIEAPNGYTDLGIIDLEI